ncbi:MAG: helix-turn-helix domain-containing protein [Erysipelotrichaceae bacterium]|nr:helix-turn-helix domain-containing protein [Erysipelotrichaceae bacterium]
MKIGSNIRRWRKRAGLSQKELAKQLEVSFQAVSAWERDEYLPDTENFIKLADILDISLNKLTDEENFEYHICFFEIKELEDRLLQYGNAGHEDIIKAYEFAKIAHQGQRRKGLEGVDFIYHPLMLANHALALKLDDDIIVACLLHDVVEDTDYGIDDLNISIEAKDIVERMTCIELCDRHLTQSSYFKKLAGNKKAMLVKCLDRCHNLSDMAAGLVHYKQIRMINESEEFVLPMLRELRDSEYQDIAYLLEYQIRALLETCKRLA